MEETRRIKTESRIHVGEGVVLKGLLEIAGRKNNSIDINRQLGLFGP